MNEAFHFDWNLRPYELGSQHPYWSNYVKLSSANTYLHKLNLWNKSKHDDFLKKVYFGMKLDADIKRELLYWFNRAIGGYNHVGYRCYQPSGALV